MWYIKFHANLTLPFTTINPRFNNSKLRKFGRPLNLRLYVFCTVAEGGNRFTRFFYHNKYEGTMSITAAQ